MTAIGIDVGGTSVRVASVAADAHVSELMVAPTSTFGDADSFIVWLKSQVTAETHYVGLALPGIVNRKSGCLDRSINLPWLEGVSIRNQLSDALSCHVEVMTDADAATWGEYVSLSVTPEAFAHLRLGTGVAFGVVKGGVLLRSRPAGTTHRLELVVETGPSALPCACGMRGCLETVASGRALTEQVVAAGIGDKLIDLADRYACSDERARRITDRACRALAKAILQIAQRLRAEIDRSCHIESETSAGATSSLKRHDRGLRGRVAGLEAARVSISVGGGVAEHFPALVTRAFDIARGNDGHLFDVECALLPASQGDQAGVIGAALIAMARASSIFL